MKRDIIEIGAQVTVTYKSGEYIGVVEELRQPKAVVRIVAVRKHPTQGDLHHPHQTEAGFFHQRRALSHNEKALVPLAFISLYDGEVPEYQPSLLQALDAEIAYYRGFGDDQFAQQALNHLYELRDEYNQ